MIFDGFDWIAIVNLLSRADRRRAMRREFAALSMNGDPRVQFVEAIRIEDRGPFLRPGSHGNFLTQLGILKQAAEKGTSVLILEDDCAFRPTAATYELPKEWDIFYGGWEWASDPSDLENSEIIGSHCMGFSPRAATLAADYLTRFLSDPDFQADPEAAAKPGYNPAIRPPIDGAMVWFRRAHPELRTVFADLAFQRSSRSDVSDARFFDRIPIVREIAGVARRILGRRG